MPHPLAGITADELLNGGAAGTTIRETIPGRTGSSSTLAPTTAVMYSFAMPVYAGDIIRNAAFISSAASITPANWWFALYDYNDALLGQTPDQTTTAWGANTKIDLAFTTGAFGPTGAWIVPQTGVVYLAIMQAAATPATLVSAPLGQGVISQGFVSTMKPLARSSGSALTSTAPATIASPAFANQRVYGVAHS